jgi:hypothetical protein
MKKKNLIVKGENLGQNFPELYTKIHLEFLLGNEILVNNKKVTKEEFKTFEFIPGDRIEFSKK